MSLNTGVVAVINSCWTNCRKWSKVIVCICIYSAKHSSGPSNRFSSTELRVAPSRHHRPHRTESDLLPLLLSLLVPTHYLSLFILRTTTRAERVSRRHTRSVFCTHMHILLSTCVCVHIFKLFYDVVAVNLACPVSGPCRVCSGTTA